VDNTSASGPFHLLLVIHAHQPAGNFEHIFEESYQHSYLAFLDLLEKHPGIHLAIHYSGPLLLWIEQCHPEYFDRIRRMVSSGQIELIGGGFYEPILISIPVVDQVEQLTRLADYIEHHFGRRPTGAWLAERVWEPQLPATLAAARVDYTLVDDLSFLAAGFQADELYGSYIAEDLGKSVRLFPGLRDLRYLIPFRKVEESIVFLRNAAESHPGHAAAFGDDMEKFGVWPGTFRHCYLDGWLDQFFSALEANSSWLKTSTPSEYIASHPPLGRADLPSSSYAEMMEWVLPTSTREQYGHLKNEFSARPDLLNFVRGGSWRGFFCKYREANLLHKKMLRASARVAAVPPRRSSPDHTNDLRQARDFLLRGQGNDAYWHGVFGGIYAPHLRTEILRNLIRAETLADRLTPGGLAPRVDLLDYDVDGATELLFTAPEYQALVKPSDGATIAAFDFRLTASTLINSMFRGEEAYHSRVKGAAVSAHNSNTVSIHDQVRSKEPNLDRFLRYDRFTRSAFRILLFDSSRSHGDYESLQLQELAGPAGGVYELQKFSPNNVTFSFEAFLPMQTPTHATAPNLQITKQFLFGPTPHGCEVSCDVQIRISGPLDRPLSLGIESVVNLLAPTEPDRFFETQNGPQNLRFSGILPAPVLRMEDHWQRFRLTLHAAAAQEFWVAPIETVSESEGGFERVYQGSQILALWPVPAASSESNFSARLLWRIETL
jgi:4-alpha-glucanotransferase